MNTNEENSTGNREQSPPAAAPVLISVDDEVDRFFDESSLPVEGRPKAIILMGPPAAGKTTLRKRRFASGFVLIDAVPIFLSLSRGVYYPFPEPFCEQLEILGSLIASRAISERRNILTEIIGNDFETTSAMFDALKLADYAIEAVAVNAPVEQCAEWNMMRGDDDISAFYAEEFQIRWITASCREFSETSK
jgi:hypothetical protein